VWSSSDVRTSTYLREVFVSSAPCDLLPWCTSTLAKFQVDLFAVRIFQWTNAEVLFVVFISEIFSQLCSYHSVCQSL
ncbi:Bifunctional enzyme IspD/IspF, partial [Frankliniella fusca]